MGIATRSIVLHEHEEVDFSVDVGEVATRIYTQTVVVYYAYQEGFRRGMASVNGVFAVFQVKGKERYIMQDDDQTKLLDQKVTATFKGFTKTLHAEEKAESK